jgi:exopolyphosphatase/pppGpp-phosphohydrolase
LSFNPFNVELIRLDYDAKAAADALRKKALPESFAQMLLRGVSLETIIEEDHTDKDAMVQNCREIAEVSQKISKTYWQDTEHYTQVARLALEFFDGLISVHQLGGRERCWLECAAILHDVGLSRDRGGHHKVSAKLILNDTQLPFTSLERRVVASIARYHRKGLPKSKQYNLAALDRLTVYKVKILAGLLRVADSLDCSHQSIVKSISVKVDAKRIIVECVCETEWTLEEQAFNKKKDLLETVFAKTMVLVWRQQ